MKNGALHRFVGIGAAIASLAVLAMMLIGAADVTVATMSRVSDAPFVSAPTFHTPVPGT